MRHDHLVECLYLGEPFLQEGILTYFDGSAVQFCGIPLAGEAPASDDKTERVLSAWAERLDVKTLTWIGTRPLDLGFLSSRGFRRVESEGGRQCSAELLIDCLQGAGKPARERTYRRSRRLGLVARLMRGGTPRAEHLRVIGLFQRARGIHEHSPESVVLIPSLLSSHDVYLVEARSGAELCGVVGLHKPFRRTAVALFLAHDDVTRGVSDFLYGEMLAVASSLGATQVNVGPSPSSGHLAFKKKWGGRDCVPPYHRCSWAREKLAAKEHTSWAARMLRYG